MSRLAALIEAKVAKHVPAEKPRLQVVGGTEHVPGEDGESRERLLARIRDFARMYYLAWLVRQETTHAGKALEDFSDDELGELMRKMEKGRDCRNEDISFDDAGLVRGAMGQHFGY